jgi:hypothetical protein
MSDLCLILGAPCPARREVAEDLARFAWPEGVATELLPGSPEDGPGRAWTFADGVARLPAAEGKAGVLLTDGRRSQVDQLEALFRDAPAAGWTLRRLVTVIDLPLLHRRPGLVPWFKACAHFSDAVVLAGRHGVPNAWLSELQRDLGESLGPCLLVALPREGGLPRPSEILEGDPRRMSLVLDDLDAVDEMEFDEDNLPDEPFDLVRPVDPYFERDATGRRMRHLPDIAAELAADAA